MKNGTIPFFTVLGKQKTGQSREKRDSWQVWRCERPQTKNQENNVKVGKNAKNGLKIKEKDEILAQ